MAKTLTLSFCCCCCCFQSILNMSFWHRKQSTKSILLSSTFNNRKFLSLASITTEKKQKKKTIKSIASTFENKTFRLFLSSKWHSQFLLSINSSPTRNSGITCRHFLTLKTNSQSTIFFFFFPHQYFTIFSIFSNW